jgi:hypothetical protein
MRWDEVDELLRAALTKEVEEGAKGLAGLEERVIRELARRPVRRSFWERVREFLSRPTPRWALVGALAALLLGFALGRLTVPSPVPQWSPNLFVIAAPGAKSVAVVGDFSAWQPIPLSDPDGDGIWSASIPLPPGRYEYAFLVDGKWVGQDPLAEEYLRTFGEYVSVRYIGGGRANPSS